MKVYGLTGGTGSGKSTAATRFADHGIAIVDADRLGHELIAPGGRAEAAVKAAFGKRAISCGKIDRSKLGQIVFSDSAALDTLNAIVHPMLAEEISARCIASATAGHRVCMVDAALLGEGAALEPWLDGLALVVASRAVRIGRLMAHRGLDEATAQARIAAQLDPEQKRVLARWIIENDGGLADLYARVDAVATEMLQPERSA